MTERFARLIDRVPVLASSLEQVEAAYERMVSCFAGGGKLLACGNGGSCADAEHIVGELMKGFMLRRPIPPASRDRLHAVAGLWAGPLADGLQQGLPAVALGGSGALTSAIGNDISADLIYAQQVYSLGTQRDLLLALSTSGNARNVLAAVAAARLVGMAVVCLTGRDGGELAGVCDVAVRVPADATPDVQELHVAVYHALCAAVENRFFGAGPRETVG